MVCNQAADLPSQNIRAETYGPGSRCIEQGRQWLLTTNGFTTTSPVFGSGCYQVLHSEHVLIRLFNYAMTIEILVGQMNSCGTNPNYTEEN